MHLRSILPQTIKPHQRHGIVWCVERLLDDFGCLLADFMGLGKTMQAALVMKCLHLVKKTNLLVVAPKSLIPHWHTDAWHAEGEDCKRNSCLPTHAITIIKI